MNSTTPLPVSQAARELLPCPFCGGEAQRLTLGPDDGPGNEGGDIITCSRCYASSNVEFGRKENLVSHWNTRSGEREPAPSSERELLHLIRNALYQHLPTEVDADTCRAVADEVIKAIGGEGAPEVDDDLVGRLCKLHSKMRPKTRGPDRWRPRMIEVSLSEATTVIKAAVELERYRLASPAQEPALDLHKAAKALLDDVRRRYPGEALRCEYMIALDEAVNALKGGA